ncbi:MAG: hypothetical protein ACYST9_00865 [Planctomycetota bacterium]|jgi:hypothetical protein
MEGRNHLGIYLGKDAATVVCLSVHGSFFKLIDSFNVSIDSEQQQGQSDIQQLAQQISKGCVVRGLEFSDVAIALDCSMFMQHNINSAFTDQKQILETIRFDTEETLAYDISSLALTFKITSNSEQGSQLMVFTAEKKILKDIIQAFQANNIDPIAVEPDVSSLSSFLCHNLSLPEDSHPLFALLSENRGYCLSLSDSNEPSFMRTFLISPKQDRNDLLAREILVSGALAGAKSRVNCTKVFDSADVVSETKLGQKTSLETEAIDLLAGHSDEEINLFDELDAVDFAIAAGAALTLCQKTSSPNFRDDFMPYLGKKQQMEKTIKILSISVGILIVVVGVYFRLQLLQKNSYRSKLRKKYAGQYSVVMRGKHPGAKSDSLRKLSSELRRIRDVKSGQLSVTGEQSISAKLTLVLEAFNKYAKEVDLNIESVSISTKSISIVGDTSGPGQKNTLKLFKAIKGKFDILQEQLDSKGGRANFRITVALKNN